MSLSTRHYPVVNGSVLYPPSVIAERLGTTRERVYTARNKGVLVGSGPRQWITEASVAQLEQWIRSSLTVNELAHVLGKSRATSHRLVQREDIPSDDRWGIRISKQAVTDFLSSGTQVGGTSDDERLITR